MIDTPVMNGNGGGHVRPVPNDYEYLKQWFAIIREARTTIVIGSIQFLTITAMIDKEGRPVLWADMDTVSVHPYARDIKFTDGQ
jgi:hypothetical protein